MARRFEFRLEKLLGVRRSREEAAQRDLDGARKAVFEQNQAILPLLQEKEGGKQALRDLQRKTINILQVRFQEEYLERLERNLCREVEKLQELGRVEGEKGRALIEACKGVRILERFREKKVAAWRLEIEREELKVLDEVNGRVG
jgi:flagellar export protein FliJ